MAACTHVRQLSGGGPESITRVGVLGTLYSVLLRGRQWQGKDKVMRIEVTEEQLTP